MSFTDQCLKSSQKILNDNITNSILAKTPSSDVPDFSETQNQNLDVDILFYLDLDIDLLDPDLLLAGDLERDLDLDLDPPLTGEYVGDPRDLRGDRDLE